MSVADFKASLSDDAPARGLDAPLAALWWAARGKWDDAHHLVQDEPTAGAAWVHAYLHRVEGDLGNAGYWSGGQVNPLRRMHSGSNGTGSLPR